MPLTSIIIKPEWYAELKWGLEEVKKRGKSKNQRSLARTSLRMLESGKRKFDKGEWDQLVFTIKETKFLTELSEALDMPEASKRFSAVPVRV